MKLILSVAILIFSSLSIPSNLQERDLSGAWRLTASNQGKSVQYDILLIKTSLQPGGDPFYQVIGYIFDAELIGLRIRKRPDNGLWHLSWYGFKLPNDSDVDGTRLDGEGNMVLHVLDEDNTLVLGGDSETNELARLTRLTWFDEPTPSTITQPEI
jgi:hypothetical protein